MKSFQPSDAQQSANDAGLDNDTVQFGTGGPFDYWEADHTALVHVLWHARHTGLVLGDDARRIAELVAGSRFLAAVRHFAGTNTPSMSRFAADGDLYTGTTDELEAVLRASAAAGGGLSGEAADRTASAVRSSGWFTAVHRAAGSVLV